MSNIAPPGWNQKITHGKWNTEPGLYGSNVAAFAIPVSGSIIFYDGQAIGRNKLGQLVQCDDTAAVEFVGILTDVAAPGYTTIQSTDTLGQWWGKVVRDYCFKVKLANAAKGMEGLKVFWKYNNEVALTGTSFANYAGTILNIEVAAVAGYVWVLAPWLEGTFGSNDRGIITTAAAAGTTLTKFDVNKLIIMPLTSSEAITLPAASATSPGDRMTFINTSANTSTPTLTPAGGDTINGAASYAQSTTQYSVAVLRSDGISAWYVEVPGPGGTVGATTFTGNVGVSSATLTVTDNVDKTLAVGRLGATTPAFDVDCSVGTCITGVKITARGTGAGVTLATIGETNVDLLVAPNGSGGVKITSTSATGLLVGPNGATNPTLSVVCNVGSEAGGLKVTGGIDAAGVALAAIGSNTNEPITIDAKGSGVLLLGSVSTGGVRYREHVSTLAATGNAIGNAAALTEGYTYVTGSNNNAAVLLPVGAVGMRVAVVNSVYTGTLPVFPQVNDAINNLGANNVYSIGNGGYRLFTFVAANQWYSNNVTIN